MYNKTDIIDINNLSLKFICHMVKKFKDFDVSLKDIGIISTYVSTRFEIVKTLKVI